MEIISVLPAKWERIICYLLPKLFIPLYAFLSPKKAFTPSHGVCFHLIFKGFKCEGLIFQAFTPQGALGQLFLLIAKGFPVWRIVHSTLHKPSQPVWRPWNPTLHTSRGVRTADFQIANDFPMWRIVRSTLHKPSQPVWRLWNPTLHT